MIIENNEKKKKKNKEEQERGWDWEIPHLAPLATEQSITKKRNSHRDLPYPARHPITSFYPPKFIIITIIRKAKGRLDVQACCWHSECK